MLLFEKHVAFHRGSVSALLQRDSNAQVLFPVTPPCVFLSPTR